jgi:hypothetical protein
MKHIDRIAGSVARRQTRRGVSRVLAMRGLGVLAVATGLTATPTASRAKRRQGRQRQQAANRLCQRQLEPCKASVAKHCQLDPVACQAAAGCCKHVARCRLTDFFSCLVLPTADPAFGRII